MGGECAFVDCLGVCVPSSSTFKPYFRFLRNLIRTFSLCQRCCFFYVFVNNINNNNNNNDSICAYVRTREVEVPRAPLILISLYVLQRSLQNNKKECLLR